MGDGMSAEQFGTRTEKFFTDCGKCGARCTQQVNYGGGLLTMRFVCDACGSVTYGVYSDGYKPRDDTKQLQMTILDVFAEQDKPLTVRQVFYQCSSVYQVVPKDDAGYRRVQSQLVSMRRAGSVPYNWLADNARYFIKPTQYNGLESALDRMQASYRRNLWEEQASYVEVWVEKDAMAGALSPITQEFGVPLYVARGYSSLSFASTAAEQIKEVGKPAYVYHLGDWDYDGVHASQCIRDELRRHGAKITYERLAVTPQQIAEYGLPTRPQKTKSPRRRWFTQEFGDSPACELDAMPPKELRRLVRAAITRHINQYEWVMSELIEKQERATLAEIVRYAFRSNEE